MEGYFLNHTAEFKVPGLDLSFHGLDLRFNPALEASIQPWKLRFGFGNLKPALEAQIQPWKLKSSPGSLNLALEA